jgi:hypothetical protein
MTFQKHDIPRVLWARDCGGVMGHDLPRRGQVTALKTLSELLQNPLDRQLRAIAQEELRSALLDQLISAQKLGSGAK